MKWLCVAAALFSSSLCGKQIAITNTQNQKAVTATVADKCSVCTGNNLDLTTPAFQQIGGDTAQGNAPSALHYQQLFDDITDKHHL